MKKLQKHLALSVMAPLALLAASAFAQTGNLLLNGRFDLVDGVIGWEVLSPQSSSLTFDPMLDFDACTGSGSALATTDPNIDFGTAVYKVCLGAVAAGQSYRISGEILFPSSAVAGRSNLTLNFMTGPNCDGTANGGLFAGYVLSSVAGWQHVAAGPADPDVSIQSVLMSVMLTQLVGAEPALQAHFDEIRVTLSDGTFADDFELGEGCRWSVVLPEDGRQCCRLTKRPRKSGWHLGGQTRSGWHLRRWHLDGR